MCSVDVPLGNAAKESVNVEFFLSGSGEETARFRLPDGKSCTIHSTVDPQKEAEMLIDAVDTTKSCLYIVFGLGLGYHLKSLIKRMTPSSRAIVLEPSDGLFSLWKERGIIGRVAEERLSFISGDSQAIIPKLDMLLRGQNMMVAGNLRFVELPAYGRVFKEWVSEIESQLIKMIRNRIFEMGNDVADTLQGIRQIMHNIGETVCSVGADDLKGAYRGLPAVVVSAGPSLNKNVDLLHKVKGKALILCVDASLNVLLKKGIMPDAVLSIERGVETYNYFYKGQTLPDEPVLIAPPVIYPDIFDEYPGEKFIPLREGEGINMWFESIMRRGTVTMGTSVAHLAFGFARLVGADPIILIGQDLAYSSEGLSHGEGVAVGEKQDLSKAEVWVEGYDGQLLPSRRVWKYFLTWFETAVAETDSLCIDATEGGARIKGTEIMTFSEAIDKYCLGGNLLPLRDLVSAKKPGSISEDLENVLGEFRKLISFFEIAGERAKKGIHLLDKIEKETNFNRASREKLLKVVKKIKANDEVVKYLFGNLVAVMFFQTMLFMVNQQLADMGDRLSAENVRKNIQVQRWFLERVSQLSSKIVEELETILGVTLEKLKDQNLLPPGEEERDEIDG